MSVSLKEIKRLGETYLSLVSLKEEGILEERDVAICLSALQKAFSEKSAPVIDHINELFNLDFKPALEQHPTAFYHVFGRDDYPDNDGWKKPKFIAQQLLFSDCRSRTVSVDENIFRIEGVDKRKINALVIWPHMWPDDWEKRLNQKYSESELTHLDVIRECARGKPPRPDVKQAMPDHPKKEY
jgi:hypothetical protein